MSDVDPTSDLQHWRAIYTSMVRTRFFEEKLVTLLFDGKVTTPCHLYIGQEGIASGVCEALRDDDTIWGGHRSHGHYLAKGGDMNAMMAEIFCRTPGCSGGRGGSMHVFAPEVGLHGTVPLVAGTIPLAVGAALAAKLQGLDDVAVPFFGDGATEEGHFHESMNLAAAHKLPVIFVCENNFYSSHMGLLERRAADNIVLSADAHGMAGEAIDGNDAVAVFEATRRAIKRARAGEGPTLIEARTFRHKGHVGPRDDMDVGVLRKDELKDWLPKDPLPRLRGRLVEAGVAGGELEAVEAAAREAVDASLEFALAQPHPDASTYLNHVFVQREA